MYRYLSVALTVLLVASAGAGRLVRLRGMDYEGALTLQAEGYKVAAGNLIEHWVDVMISDESEATMLTRYSDDVKVLPREFAELLPENSRDAGYYYSPGENWTFWCTLAEDHSDLADTPMTIGQSYEGRDIYMIKMTSGSGPPDKPALYYSSLIHAREPGGNSVLIDFATWLADNYNSDTRATFILDNAEVYFVPIANPDGYEYNMPGGGNQRKNMNWTNGDGIDLNRNWEHKWGYDDQGSSPDPYDETYRGTSPASEVETQEQRDFMNDVAPIAALHYHTYGGYLLYPWGYVNQPTPDQSTFESWAAHMTMYNGYEYGRAGQVLYPVNGEQCDYSYSDTLGSPSILAMTPEVADNGFWGGQNDTTLIEEFCEDCRWMNIIIAMNALEYVGVETPPSFEARPMLFVGAIAPNPVSTAMSFDVRAQVGTNVEATIFDLCGRKVANLDLGRVADAGVQAVNWSVPEDLSSGVYMLRVENGGDAVERRFTVLK
ncbi:T9SS type A sorting domain-containing protein [Candidatus Fermentibacteria bacterium]|nr:T9SS type A sorting domain-containing protein [Candidatus Fermentibacteria bacterium]